MGVIVREKVHGSGVYWVFINHQGKRTSKRVGSEGVAQKIGEQIQARLTLGREFLPARRKRAPTLALYFDRIKKNYLKTATRPRTLESYQTNFDLHILPRLGSRQLDDISKEDVRNLIAGLVDADKAKATIRIIVAELCAVLNHAIEDELINRNPAAKCSKFYAQSPIRNEEIQPLTPEEVRLFLKAVLNRKTSMKHYPLFLCAIHTGMRSGEIAGLRWEDIDRNSRFLTVRRSYADGRIQRTKTGRIRRVDLSDALLEAFREHRRNQRQYWLKKGVNELPEWVFANEKGKPLDMRNLRPRHFKKCLDDAGLRGIRFHDLRHTYASLLIQNREPLAYIKDQLGHSSIKMTVDVYGHLEPGRNREAVNQLPTIESAPVGALETASNA